MSMVDRLRGRMQTLRRTLKQALRQAHQQSGTAQTRIQTAGRRNIVINANLGGSGGAYGASTRQSITIRQRGAHTDAQSTTTISTSNEEVEL